MGSLLLNDLHDLCRPLEGVTTNPVLTPAGFDSQLFEGADPTRLLWNGREVCHKHVPCLCLRCGLPELQAPVLLHPVGDGLVGA